MTHSPNNLLERQLTNELRQAESVYRRSLAMVQASLAQVSHEPGQMHTQIDLLQPFLDQIQQTEHRLSPLRESWIQQGRKPGPELTEALARQEQILADLIERVNSLESSLQQQRRAAIPGVDRFVKHQQMQRAYQQISR